MPEIGQTEEGPIPWLRPSGDEGPWGGRFDEMESELQGGAADESSGGVGPLKSLPSFLGPSHTRTGIGMPTGHPHTSAEYALYRPRAESEVRRMLPLARAPRRSPGRSSPPSTEGRWYSEVAQEGRSLGAGRSAPAARPVPAPLLPLGDIADEGPSLWRTTRSPAERDPEGAGEGLGDTHRAYLDEQYHNAHGLPHQAHFAADEALLPDQGRRLNVNAGSTGLASRPAGPGRAPSSGRVGPLLPQFLLAPPLQMMQHVDHLISPMRWVRHAAQVDLVPSEAAAFDAADNDVGGAGLEAIFNRTITMVHRSGEDASSQSDMCAEECIICCDAFMNGEYLRMLPCLHKYHALCVDRWLVRSLTCPVCKHDITDLGVGHLGLAAILSARPHASSEYSVEHEIIPETSDVDARLRQARSPQERPAAAEHEHHLLLQPVMVAEDS
eukprot:NODE_4145_length_1930_cov_10.570161.p1 GENE.NODE_4145_length_1930_cov_10.570161~~NODE_4145_length_1930_cov_10.570161.p1  ORF type:complete len:440 (-),score=102.85 NODE_4145_length_1930_cov_10.570161:207-1526(-)